MDNRRLLINLRQFAAPCMCGVMLVCTLAVLFGNDVARKNFEPEWSSHLPWILGPFAVVGTFSLFARKNAVASSFGLLATILATLITSFGVYPELFRESREVSQIGVAIIGTIQWMVLGALMGLGLISAFAQWFLRR